MRFHARRRLRRLGLLAIAALALYLVPTLWFKPWRVDDFYARVFLEFALRHPMLLTQLGVLDDLPVNPTEGRFDDLSVAATDREARFVDRNLATLRSYDPRGMSAGAKLSRDVLEWFLADQAEGTRFRYHNYPVNQLFGMQSELPNFLLSSHPLKKPRDAAAYVERVSRLGIAADQVIAGLAHRESLGVVPPRFVLERVVDQMERFTQPEPRSHPLFVRFDTTSSRIPGLAPARRAELETRLANEIERTVYPAYRRWIAECRALMKVATDDDGVWHLPDGDAYYDWCLRNHTTTALSADSIHALGLAEVTRVEDEMRAVLNSVGAPAGAPGPALRALAAEPRFHYPAGDSSRARILADYRAMIAEASRRSALLFGTRPKAGVEVRRMAAFSEPTSPAAFYQPGTIGGARPGVFFVKLLDPAAEPTLDMRTLAYHEAIPGHHFQISIAQEMSGVPFFRRIIPFTAYIEGWALYAERLAFENGFHPTAYDSLGALRAELFRATRLVVDTGIHRKRWTRRQAIDYMMSVTGMGEAEVTAEVERYIVDPGQACAYKMGELEIRALRDRARARLGDRFDLRGFHDVVLKNGALPLGLLERVVDEWIEAQQRGRPEPPASG